ncbi:MarR family winged helix-turn-helix transcriptional regulator [Gordonia sp. NPDC003425]
MVVHPFITESRSPMPSVSSDTAGAATIGTDTTDVAALHHHLVRITRSLRTSGTGNLSAGVASALWSVIGHGPLRLSELAERESVTMPTMSRIVAGLEQQGLVARTPDPEDGRARLLVATDAGTELIRHARSAKAQLLAAAIGRLDAAEQEEVVRSVETLADALSDTVCERTVRTPSTTDPR